MKPTTLALVALSLCACKKEDRTIRYAVICEGCHVSYVNSDEDFQHVTVKDTLWTYEFEAEHDQTARVDVRHVTTSFPTAAMVFVDNVLSDSAWTVKPGSTIVVKD